MKQALLKELLEKYYNALTTQEEEQILIDLLSSDDLPPEYFSDRDALVALMEMATHPEPDNLFESRMESAIFPPAQSLSNAPHTGRYPHRRVFISLLSSAAVVLLVVSAWFMIGNKSEPSDSFSSPELAYAETLKTLHRVSSEMNRATSKLRPLESIGRAERSMQSIGETGRLIDRGFSELETVQKALTGKGLTND